MTLSRRGFFGLGAAAATQVIRSAQADDSASETSAITKPASGPVAISSANGLRGVERAQKMILQGADPLDAAIAGVNIQELDPEDHSVGLGGLPNADGVVQLDASCMHGPTRRAGAVGAIESIATPSLVAKAVMDYTDHVMLVGEGATRFALDMGFEKQELLTPASRQKWLRWKALLNPKDNWLDHDDDVKIAFTHGTINICARDASGDLGSVTTTSGLSWKIPGRVGDSPILGAGQYCDNDVGAAGSTGRGEANMKVCGAFLVVEMMRRGAKPQEACLEALKRVAGMTESRLLTADGRPRFDIEFYALAKDGRYGGATLYRSDDMEDPWGRFFAVADDQGARLVPSAALYPASARPDPEG